MISGDPHLTMRQLCFVARLLKSKVHILFFQPNLVFLMCVLSVFRIYSDHNKKKKRFMLKCANVCMIEQVSNDVDYLNNVTTADEI